MADLIVCFLLTLNIEMATNRINCCDSLDCAVITVNYSK